MRQPSEFPNVPLHQEEENRLYCRYCAGTAISREGINQHMKFAHEIEYFVRAGEDYILGRLLILERLKAMEDHALAVESLRGVEDFLLECDAA